MQLEIVLETKIDLKVALYVCALAQPSPLDGSACPGLCTVTWFVVVS